MYNHQFERAARTNRFKAWFFTILFHFLLIGGLVYSDNGQIERFVPDTVKKWIGMEKGTQDGSAKTEKTAPRP